MKVDSLILQHTRIVCHICSLEIFIIVFLILGLKIPVSKCDSYKRVLQMNPPLYFGGFIKEISGLFFAR